MSELEIYDKQGFGHSSGLGSHPALLIVDFVNGFTDPDVFGGAACVSTHWPSSMMKDNPEANQPILAWLRASIPPPGDHKLYFDFGTAELDSDYEPHQRAVDEVMRDLGYEQGPLWQTRKFEGAGHNEGAWNTRAHIPLKFLLGTAQDKE